MTVVVGVLNKKGVAIAADSATTLTKKGRVVKIVNSGNKMLRLSDVIHVGVMIVNTAKILEMPWDVIIRWYRKKRGKEEFPTVEKIVEDFLNFVQSLINVDSLPSEWNESTELVFAGYGKNQDYPTLVHIKIRKVIDKKIYYFKETDIQTYTITDDNASEIRYYGQTDIIASLTEDVRDNKLIEEFCHGISNIFQRDAKRLIKKGLLPAIFKIPNYSEEFLSSFEEYYQKDREKWLNSIKDYSLYEMARLAENLVNATELHRKIMFQQESVGGLIDLAVISKADGFQWLNRKSWYEPSRGGQYGKFGI